MQHFTYHVYLNTSSNQRRFKDLKISSSKHINVAISPVGNHLLVNLAFRKKIILIDGFMEQVQWLRYQAFFIIF